MSDVHGLIPHQTGYYYITLEEDYVLMFQRSADSWFESSPKTKEDEKNYAARKAHAVAKAYISSVLEQLSDKHFKLGIPEHKIWVFLSFPEIEARIHGGVKQRTLKTAMREMYEDGYVEKRDNPDHRWRTKVYQMNFREYRKQLNALPKRDGTTDSAYLHDTASDQEHGANLHDSSADMHDDNANMHEPQGKFAPKNNNRENIEVTQNKESALDANASTRTQSANVTDIEIMRKRKTDPDLQAVSSHSHVDIGNAIEEIDELPTEKRKAVSPQHFWRYETETSVEAMKGQGDAHHTDTSSADDYSDHSQSLRDLPSVTGDTQRVEGNQLRNGSITHGSLSGSTRSQPEVAQQKPGAGMDLSHADTPPGVGMGDATSVQASSFNADTPAQHSGYSPGLPASAGAAQVPPKRTRAKKPPVMPEAPTITLTSQQQDFWSLWCSAWFNIDVPPKLNETAREHIVKLAPHITTAVQLISLIDFTRKDLEAQGVKRKQVHLGNLVNCYSGWKQSQQPAKTNGAPPNSINHENNMRKLEERKAKFVANGGILKYG